jgi:DNA-binding beta-propeller fold protein YncE
MFRIQNLNAETQRGGVRSAGSRNSAPLRLRGWKILEIFPAGVLGLLLLLILTAPLQAGKKKAEAAPENLEANRRYFDIAKIVWPSPPAIPRIAFQTIYTGQKIDWAGLQSGQRLRQSWMDRLAGEQPDYQLTNVQQKIGFQLMRVYGVAADSKGNIYAADQGVGAIFIFPHDATGKVQLIKHGVDAHLPMMNGLAMDDDDRLFVTDVKSHHVVVFNVQHKPEAQFGAGVLVSPAGIAIDSTNRFVYVVDTQQDQVLVFDADKYTLLRRIGSSGKGHRLTTPGDFSLPTHVAVDKEGNVYVTDTLNNRVEIFDADGKFISEFGKAGDGPGYFARPKGIAIDRDGHIWVTDEVQSRVQVFDRQGRLLIYFGQPGGFPGQFGALYGIAADNRNNRIITSEQYPGRVQVFRYITDAEASALKAQREAAAKTTEPEQKPVDPNAPKENAPGKAQGTGAP